MSGPKTIEYTLADAIFDSYREYQAERLRRQAELAAREAAAEAARQEAIRRREEERRAREEARRRAELAAWRMQEAREIEQTLARATSLLARAGAGDLPAPVSPPADLSNPDEVERYITGLRGAMQATDDARKGLAARAAADEGLRNLISAFDGVVAAAPRTAAEVLDLYARQLTALRAPEAPAGEARKTAVERVLGRLAGLAATDLPADLEALMRAVLEAPTEARAEALLMELRARVQQWNTERARAAEVEHENRKRELAGEIVADTLADLGYEVEPIAQTLFVEGGVAHFQRADWGDYFVRMRVDPTGQSINVNMVRVAEDPHATDSANRRRDEEMESAWCAGLPKLLDELAARGVDVRKVRAVDAGALPVQQVQHTSVNEALRNRRAERKTSTAPRAKARPIE